MSDTTPKQRPAHLSSSVSGITCVFGGLVTPTTMISAHYLMNSITEYTTAKILPFKRPS